MRLVKVCFGLMIATMLFLLVFYMFIGNAIKFVIEDDFRGAFTIHSKERYRPFQKYLVVKVDSPEVWVDSDALFFKFSSKSAVSSSGNQIFEYYYQGTKINPHRIYVFMVMSNPGTFFVGYPSSYRKWLDADAGRSVRGLPTEVGPETEQVEGEFKFW